METKSHGKSRGSVSAFVVCIALASVTVTSMVFEGGALVSEYAQLSDLAANAARLGAQSVSGIRAGEPEINVRAATSDVKQMLRGMDVASTVRVIDGYIVVTAYKNVNLRSAGPLGISSRRIAVTRRALIVGG